MISIFFFMAGAPAYSLNGSLKRMMTRATSGRIISTGGTSPFTSMSLIFVPENWIWSAGA
jgi:hypothetical protein